MCQVGEELGEQSTYHTSVMPMARPGCFHGTTFAPPSTSRYCPSVGVFPHQYELIAAPSFERTPNRAKCQRHLHFDARFFIEPLRLRPKRFLLRNQVQPPMRIDEPGRGFQISS